MLVQILRHHVVHHEVKRGELPVRPVHGQVPQLGERQLAVVEGVEEEDESAGHDKAWNYEQHGSVSRNVKQLWFKMPDNYHTISRAFFFTNNHY